MENPNIQAALENNRDKFLKIVPIEELFTRLELEKILSQKQVKAIRALDDTEDMNGKLLKILKDQRTEEDFVLFCGLLKNNNVNAVKAFGAKLEAEAGGKLNNPVPKKTEISLHHLNEFNLILKYNATELSANVKDYFFLVANKIGKDWSKLGKILNQSIDTDTIKEEQTSGFDRAYAVLNKWYNMVGRDIATSKALLEALIEIERTDIADKFVSVKPFLY
ncbi:uncharacterized protein TRIADDRAFT_59584 [Trichoplax adhaerens]|uniref:Death domain-containing protein n=1 Tax=Trichoplax adhaerens TaxID=10228 RepID=B3S5E1_TRIAD|nr:predicted protein [Trichoplax adhaerens]EDV22020.1 predicted protein [Trichoplax adhaerens]|eukprot:XP_002115657.1 predicted protein [Trichoplax adhaerens]